MLDFKKKYLAMKLKYINYKRKLYGGSILKRGTGKNVQYFAFKRHNKKNQYEAYIMNTINKYVIRDLVHRNGHDGNVDIHSYYNTHFVSDYLKITEQRHKNQIKKWLNDIITERNKEDNDNGHNHALQLRIEILQSIKDIETLQSIEDTEVLQSGIKPANITAEIIGEANATFKIEEANAPFKIEEGTYYFNNEVIFKIEKQKRSNKFKILENMEVKEKTYNETLTFIMSKFRIEPLEILSAPAPDTSQERIDFDNQVFYLASQDNKEFEVTIRDIKASETIKGYIAYPKKDSEIIDWDTNNIELGSIYIDVASHVLKEILENLKGEFKADIPTLIETDPEFFNHIFKAIQLLDINEDTTNIRQYYSIEQKRIEQKRIDFDNKQIRLRSNDYFVIKVKISNIKASKKIKEMIAYPEHYRDIDKWDFNLYTPIFLPVEQEILFLILGILEGNIDDIDDIYDINNIYVNLIMGDYNIFIKMLDAIKFLKIEKLKKIFHDKAFIDYGADL